MTDAGRRVVFDSDGSYVEDKRTMMPYGASFGGCIFGMDFWHSHSVKTKPVVATSSKFKGGLP